jgi:hypothetical protein
MHLQLHKVAFEIFETCIKRYGYTGRLNDHIFEEIGHDIHLNAKELTDRNSIIHFYYQADHAFDHGNYNTQKILLLGVLLSCHRNNYTAAESLWGILNPTIEAFVTKTAIRELL